MKAPYLTIAGNEIEKGKTYWTVSKIQPFALLKHKSDEENNTVNNCYFEDLAVASMYQKSIILHAQLDAYIKAIESNHLGK